MQGSTSVYTQEPIVCEFMSHMYMNVTHTVVHGQTP